MNSKASSATLFLYFNILFIFFVSNTITCQDHNPAPNPEPAPVSNPTPANNSAPNSNTSPPQGERCTMNPRRGAMCMGDIGLLFTPLAPFIPVSRSCCKVLSVIIEGEGPACRCVVIQAVRQSGINFDNRAMDMLLNKCRIKDSFNVQCA